MRYYLVLSWNGQRVRKRNWHDLPDPMRDKVFRAFRRTLKQSDGGRQAAPQYLGGSAVSAVMNLQNAKNPAIRRDVDLAAEPTTEPELYQAFLSSSLFPLR